MSVVYKIVVEESVMAFGLQKEEIESLLDWQFYREVAKRNRTGESLYPENSLTCYAQTVATK